MIYQTSAPFTSATQAQFQTWAQSFGQALSSFGWVKQSGHGEVTDNGLTGSAFAWTNSPNVGTAASTYLTTYPQAWTFNGAWVSGATYVGANTINSPNRVDVVTNAGLTYVHITATSSLATAPGSDPTNWQPFHFEIWKSNGPMSATMPLYLKIIYNWASTGTSPCMLIQVGTGVDVNGNITGTATLNTTAPVYISPWPGNGITASATQFDMDFSGDADNFRVAAWKTFFPGNAQILAIDRAKTSTGTDSDGFAYVAIAGNMVGSARSCVILRSSLGGTIVVDTSRWAGIVSCTPTATSNFGATPPFPVFPIVGYLANPCMGIMAFSRGDVSEGTVVPVWMYGASHNYLVVGNLNASSSPDGISSRAYGAILWE